MPAPAISYIVAPASPQAPPQSLPSPPLLVRLPCYLLPPMFDPNGDPFSSEGEEDEDEDNLTLANLGTVLDFQDAGEFEPVQVLPPWYPSDMNGQ